MKGGGRAFASWSLPRGVTRPPGPGLSFQVGAVRVRYVESDPPWIGVVAEALREARGALASRSARSVAATLGRVGARFLDPGDPLRAAALELLPPTSGLSAPMAAAVLDGMATDWVEERLMAALESEFSPPELLDRFVTKGGRAVRAVAPALCVQVVSGSVPGVGATALLRSLMTKGPTLVKPGRGDVVLPVLLAEALREEDPVLGNAAAVVYWPGGSTGVEDAALTEADVVTAYGDDQAVGELRSRTPVTTRFVAYHHRVSFGVVGRDGLDAAHRHRIASEVAGSVAFFDQRGCVSPQVVYVEEGGEVAPADFAREVAGALEALERLLPGGELDPMEASSLQQLRGTAELVAASGSGVEVHHGGTRSWTVIYDPAPAFAPTCAGRVVRVKPVADVGRVPALVAPFRSHLQTAAVDGCGGRLGGLAEALARVGVSRITRFDAVPFPPAWWHHDGEGGMRPLVRWVDLEGAGPTSGDDSGCEARAIPRPRAAPPAT